MTDSLSGTQKAAILMTLIGEEAATSVLKQLETSEVRRITKEIAGMEMVDPTRYGSVLEEFHGLVRQARGLERAGAGLARKLLARTHPEHVERIMGEIAPMRSDEEEHSGSTPQLPEAIVAASTRRLAMLIREEPPQTAALVLALLPPHKAARLLAGMEQDRRTEVTRRMAGINEIRPNIVDKIGETLLSQMEEIAEDPLIPLNGVRTAADALTNLGRVTGREIVDALEDGYPELSARLGEMLFTFDMLLGLGDRDAQEVLRQVDRTQLAAALKGADPGLHVIFLRNMSERAGQMLKEEMEFLGALKLAEIEAAQREMIEIVLKLEKEGTITLEEQAVAAG
ncbi:MAG: flagellar motor switch protein FliG [Acidobacteriota bacterium]|nr:flagellar motor switch protein FliG [Acidobacteriota bacterium]